MPELFNLRLGAGSPVTQTAHVINHVRKLRSVYMEPKRSGDCEQRENQHRFILRGPVARAISSERRDESSLNTVHLRILIRSETWRWHVCSLRPGRRLQVL